MASRDLRVTLIGEDRTGSAFGSAGRQADGLGSKFADFGRVAAVGLGGAVAAAGLFAKSGVDAFARVEDATGAATVQFGDATAEIVEFANAASTNFGLSKGAALDAANTFGTMGKAAGLSGDDLADFSTDFVGLAGDMASFKGTSPEQAIEAIGAALRGETEPIRAYGVLLDDASMRAEALKLGLIATTEEALTPQQKVLAAQSLIYQQTTAAQGDFQRTSESTANTAKRLAAETENASARLGEQLAPAVTTIRELFLRLLNSASRFVDYIGPGVSTLMTAFQAFWAALREGDVTSDGLVGAFETVGDALHRVGQVVIPMVVGAFEWISSAVMSTIGLFREHDGALTALGAVVGVIAAVVVAAWVAQGVVSTINAAKSVISWFTVATASTTSATIQSRSTAQIAVGWVLASVQAAFGAARIVASWALMGVQAVASAALTAAAWVGAQIRTVASLALMAAGFVAQGAVMVASAALTAAGVVAGWVLMGAQAMLQAARMAAAWFIALGPVGWVTAAVIGLVALIVANWETVVAWTQAAWSAVTGAISAAWEWIKSSVSAALGVLTEWFLNFTGPGLIIQHWNDIVAWTRSAWSAVTGAVSGAFNAITGAIQSGVSTAVSFVSGLPGQLVAAVGNLGSLLYQKGKDLIQGLLNGAGSLLSSIGRFFLDKVPSWIRGPFESALGISSPSKVFAGYGENIGEGLINGMAGMRPAVASQMQALADTGALGALGVPGAGGVAGRTGGGAGGGGLLEQLLAAISDRPTIGQVTMAPNESAGELADRLAYLARTQ